MSAPSPYFPVRVAEGGAAGNQRLHPAVGMDGVPLWQPGDTNVRAWRIDSLGWCHGNIDTRRDHAGVTGALYLTDSRVIAVAGDFEHGSTYSAIGIGSQQVVAAVATRVSRARARRANQGKFLVAQMRLPWLGKVIFGPPGVAKGSRGELRLQGQHRTAFGDPESVLLLARLRQPKETFEVVSAIIERVRSDRYAWERTTDNERAALDRVPLPSQVVAAEGSLPAISLAGSFRISGSSANQGSASSRSFPDQRATASPPG